MGSKRQIYSSHKHFWHLDRKKTARLESIYRQIEVEFIGHGDYPVDMPLDENLEMVNAIQK